MRLRSWSVLLAFLVVVVACGDDTGDTTTAAPGATSGGTDTETTEEPVTTVIPADAVPMLADGSIFATTAVQGPSRGTGAEIFELRGLVLPEPEFLPNPSQTAATQDATTGLFSGESQAGNCRFLAGQILTTKLGAESVGADVWVDLAEREVPDLPSVEFIDPLSGDPIGIATVAVGTEIEALASLLRDGDGQNEQVFADLNRVVLPSPKWQYGPSTDARVFDFDEYTVSDAEPGANAVRVIDLFYIEGGSDADASGVGQHGEFVAGIVERLGATAKWVNVNFHHDLAVDSDEYEDGVSDTSLVAQAIGEGVNNLSIGAPLCAIDPPAEYGAFFGNQAVEFPPLIIALAIRQLTAAGVDVVAAAGNRYVDENSLTTEPDCAFQWYPAALAVPRGPADQATSALEAVIRTILEDVSDHVTSVGALAWNGAEFTQASFSMCGANTVWMPGTDIISDYNDGHAVWDGTSFAAPYYAALLATGVE